MTERPPIRPGDWITIGRADCVVSRLYPPGDPSGDCEVVHNPAKPSNDDEEQAYPVSFDKVIMATPFQFSNIKTGDGVMQHPIDGDLPDSGLGGRVHPLTRQ